MERPPKPEPPKIILVKEGGGGCSCALALLAAFIVMLLAAVASAASFPLEIPPQSDVPNAVYTHPACVCFPPGWTNGEKLTLLENGRPVQHQFHVRSRWPDGSVKWLHDYAQFKFVSGKPLRYDLLNLKLGPQSFVTPPLPEMPVTTPYLKDDLGREFTAGNVVTETLDNGPLAKVYRVAGDMVSNKNQADPLMRVAPFLRFEYWCTTYAQRTDCQFAFTVCSHASGLRLASLGIRTAKDDSGKTVLCLRDEGRRLPHAAIDNSTVSLWPSGGLPSVPATAANLHTYPWLHSGRYLRFDAPDDAYELALKLQSESEKPYRKPDGTLDNGFWGNAEWSETRAENLRTSTADGISIVCKFSLVKKAPGETDVGWQKLTDLQPVAKPSPQWIADSGALGRIAPRSKTYEQFESAVEAALLGYNDPAKCKAFGWATYGNAPERTSDGRPYQHRASSYNHYWLHQLWLESFRGAPPQLIDTARRATGYLAAFGQCRNANARADGLPVTRSKTLWGFYHSGNFYPWGTTDYGLGWPDTECALTGHWVDPYALQLSWLHDCNWFHKSGYDGWASAVDLDRGGFGRESNTALAQYAFAYRYTADVRFLDAAKRTASQLITRSLKEQTAGNAIGVLAYPTWPLLADEVLNSDASRKYILDNAAEIASRPVAWHIEGISTLAVIARAVELGGDPAMLTKVMPPKPPVKQNLLELGPGPLGEWHQAIAWPVAQKCLNLN